MGHGSLKEFINSKNGVLLGIAIVLAVIMSFLNVNLPWFIFVGGVIFCVITAFIFKNPFLGILLVAFFLPFERIGAYEFGLTTIRISQIVLIVTAVVWVANLLIKRRFGLTKNPVLIPLAFFMVVNLLSLPNALNMGRSLTVLAYIFFTIILAWLVPNIVKTKLQIKKIVYVVILGFVIVSVFGLWQFLGDMSGLPTTVTGLRDLYTNDVLGFTRVQSTAYEPLYFANYLLIPLSIIFALFLSGRGLIKSGWLITLFGLGMVNLILTVSRGGYLAIFFTLLVISLFYLRKLFTFKNILIFTVACLIVIWVATRALGVGGELFTVEKFQEHVGNAFYGASYDERIETFDQAMAVWHQHPWVGIGPGGFGTYTATYPYYMPEDGWRIVNNEFIEILAENGIIGLLFFILFILFLIIRSLKAIKITDSHYLRAVMVGLLGAFIGVLVQYQTFSTLYIMHVWFLIGLMIAVQNIVFERHKLSSK